MMETMHESMRRPARAGHLVLGLAVLGLLAGCDGDPTGPGAPGTQTVSLSVTLKSAGGPSPALLAQGLQLTDGTNTIEIMSAELVLRDLEFERVGTFACDSVEAGDDDCEKFEVGPFLIALPLDGSVTTQLTTQVDTGRYDEIDFDIHKPDDDDPADLEFIDQHPAFADVSIRVTGTYNGQAFDYVTDLNEEQEVELSEPLVVDEDTGPVNVTLTIDLDTWFRNGFGTLVDPATALKGGPNEDLVETNIEASIEGFRDDDEDGVPHGEDDDEGDDI